MDMNVCWFWDDDGDDAFSYGLHSPLLFDTLTPSFNQMDADVADLLDSTPASEALHPDTSVVADGRDSEFWSGRGQKRGAALGGCVNKKRYRALYFSQPDGNPPTHVSSQSKAETSEEKERCSKSFMLNCSEDASIMKKGPCPPNTRCRPFSSLTAGLPSVINKGPCSMSYCSLPSHHSEDVPIMKKGLCPPTTRYSFLSSLPDGLPNVVDKGRKLQKEEALASTSVAYPFEFIKPSESQGDVTLDAINRRIMSYPPIKLSTNNGQRCDEVLRCRPLPGKSVIACAKIHTEGKGIITIMKTKYHSFSSKRGGPLWPPTF